MKTLEITQEVEQALVHVFDAALKAGGMSLLQNIDKIRNSIVLKPIESPFEFVEKVSQ